MKQSTSVFNAIFEFFNNDECSIWIIPKDPCLRGKPIQLPINGDGIITWIKSIHCQINDEELKSLWENFLETGNITSFLDACQPYYLSKDLMEALLLSFHRKVKWELWPNYSTNKNSLTTITFKNSFNRNGELCVILPSNLMSSNANSLLSYSQTIYETISKDCKMKESIEPIQVGLFETVLRRAYPISDSVKDKCENLTDISFLND